MQPIVVSVGPLAVADADNIYSGTPTKGPLTLAGDLVTGTVATMDTPRQVLLTTTVDETLHTFTITGTDWAGSSISEVITGVNNGTVASVLSYATVTSIVISANATGSLTFGTNGIAASPWVRFDGWANPVIAIQCVASGTVNYTVQQTLDDPNSPTNPVNPNAVTWTSCPTAALVGATTTQVGNYNFCPIFARVLLNSQTNPGFVTATFQQSSVVPY